MAKDVSKDNAEAVADNLETDVIVPVGITNEEIAFAHQIYSAELVRARQAAELEIKLKMMKDGYDPSQAAQFENQERSLEDGAWVAEYERLWADSARLQTPIRVVGNEQVRAMTPDQAKAGNGEALIEAVTKRDVDEVDTYPAPNPAMEERRANETAKAEKESRANAKEKGDK
jgi:hypothetical protein